MKNNRNCSIDILRLVFAVLIVALHTSPFIEFSETGSYLVSQTISRLAVPFFSTVTGFFFFESINIHYLLNLKKYITIYTFWSFLMFIYDAFRWNNLSTAFILYILKTYFLTGWNHLWYLLAIIYTIVFLAIANKITKRANTILLCISFILLIIGIAASSYGKLFSDYSLISVVTSHHQSMFFGWFFIVFPFFMLGFALKKEIFTIKRKHSFLVAVLCIIGLFSEIAFTTIFDLHNNVVLCLFTYPTVYCLFTWALNNPYSHLRVIAKYCAGMASVIYFGHVVIASYLRSVNTTETMTFLISLLTTAIVGMIFVKLNNPVINKLI